MTEPEYDEGRSTSMRNGNVGLPPPRLLSEGGADCGPPCACGPSSRPPRRGRFAVLLIGTPRGPAAADESRSPEMGSDGEDVLALGETRSVDR